MAHEQRVREQGTPEFWPDQLWQDQFSDWPDVAEELLVDPGDARRERLAAADRRALLAGPGPTIAAAALAAGHVQPNWQPTPPFDRDLQPANDGTPRPSARIMPPFGPRRSAMFWCAIGFGVGIAFWHWIGFWSFVSDVVWGAHDHVGHGRHLDVIAPSKAAGQKASRFPAGSIRPRPLLTGSADFFPRGP